MLNQFTLQVATGLLLSLVLLRTLIALRPALLMRPFVALRPAPLLRPLVALRSAPLLRTGAH